MFAIVLIIVLKLQANDIFNLFLLVSAIHGFCFSAILYFSANGKDKSMVYLNLMILALSLNNLQAWGFGSQSVQYQILLGNLKVPWHFLIAPFFYMFLVNYLEIAEKSFRVIRVAIPLFLIAIITQLVFISVYNNQIGDFNLDFAFKRYSSFEEIVSFIISISVFSYAFFVLYKKENLFPKILSLDNLRWIYVFFILCVVGYILWSIALIIRVKLNYTGFIFSYYPIRAYSTIFSYWIGYQSIIQLKLLKERRSLRETLALEEPVFVELKNDVSKEFKEIEAYIIKEKKFIEPKLTRDALAAEIGINRNKFSLIFNEATEKSFIDYMNELRVNYAKVLLTNKEYEQYTILTVGLESGFNSKSTFYHVFKKYTGKTPAGYKKDNFLI